MEERRAFSGGERIEFGDEWSAVRSGEGWPERERRISWSMLDEVYNLLMNALDTICLAYGVCSSLRALYLSRRS